MSAIGGGHEWDADPQEGELRVTAALRAGSERCPYELCDGSGFVFDDATNTAYDCRCRPQRVARRRAKSLSAAIPKRYDNVSFDRAPVTEIAPPETVRVTRSFVRSIERQLDEGHGLWFVGPSRTGKTTLSILVMKAALDSGRTAARYSLPGLLNEIRTTFDDGSYLELLNELSNVDLLVIDDIGAEHTTPWVLEQLYSIINSRYEDRKSMLVATNIDPVKLSEQITDRTVSRLEEMCGMLRLYSEEERMEMRSA